LIRISVIAGIACLALAAALGWWVYDTSYRANLERLAETGRLRVEQASDRLLGQLASYRILVNLLAEHPRIVHTMTTGLDTAATEELLLDAVLKYGAEGIIVTDPSGRVVAASAPGARGLAGSPLLSAALNHRLGRRHSLGGGRRLFRFSRGVIDGQAPARGVVQVTVSIDALEFEWGVDPEAVGFFDDAGIVVAANRQSLLLRQDRSGGQADARFRAFPAHDRTEIGGHEIWRFDAPSDLPARVLVVSREVSQISMTARGFLDVAPARSTALLRALLAAALVALAGLAGMFIALWRRRLADRLAVEETVNAQLEARVEKRTAELRATQHQLVQASKMTALGQMSAGISHELNQPLAAIMNFAQNGEKLLNLDQIGDARGNLGQITQQAERINRIIRNLRGFARNEEEAVEPVDLAAAIGEALALMETALAKSGATLHWQPPPDAVMVTGGKVRLAQVVVNLLTNALDAMAELPGPQLHMALDTGDATTRLTVRDTGPGVKDPSRVFEPFYSTKDLGASKGLGLGLSISYGIVGSFGGDILCGNHEEGGAVFTVILPRAGQGEPR